MAVLSYLDFFPTGVQRVAVATAANVSLRIILIFSLYNTNNLLF